MSGPGQAEQVGVAAQVARVVAEPLAAVVGLGQLVGLDERAHRAVEHEDPRPEQVVRGGRGGSRGVNGVASRRRCVAVGIEERWSSGSGSGGVRV